MPKPPIKLTPTQTKEFQQATKNGYTNTNSDSVYSFFFRWCEANKKPFIKIRAKVKYAYVKVDMISTNKELSAEAQNEIKSYFDTVKVLNPKGVVIDVGPVICSMDGVTKEQAEQIAKQLVVICFNPKSFAS